MSQLGLFDQEEILRRRDKKGDPLVRLNSVVDWQVFLPIIENALGRNKDISSAGRKPYPTVLMFKILIFQSLYNLVRRGRRAGTVRRSGQGKKN